MCQVKKKNANCRSKKIGVFKDIKWNNQVP